MTEYTKIETIFERDMEGTKKLIEGKFRNETVEFLKDNRWIGTEKIDGTNVGIVWDGHKVSYQGRTERAQIPTHLMNKLIEMFGGTVNEEVFEQKFGEMQVILLARDTVQKSKRAAEITAVMFPLSFLTFTCRNRIYG